MRYDPCRHSGDERAAWGITGNHRAGPHDHIVTDDTRPDDNRSGSEKASTPDLDIPALGWDLVKRRRIVEAGTIASVEAVDAREDLTVI